MMDFNRIRTGKYAESEFRHLTGDLVGEKKIKKKELVDEKMSSTSR